MIDDLGEWGDNCTNNFVIFATHVHHNNDRFPLSLIDQHERGIHVSQVHFATKEPIVGFFKEIIKDTTTKSATAKQCRQSMQLWLLNVEPDRHFDLLNTPEINRALKQQQLSHKKSHGERLKCAKSQEDWPMRGIAIEKENMLLHTACNYQQHGISFECSFCFTTSWNISISTLTRHDNIEKVCCEDSRVSHDDGPYRNFCTMELE